MGEGTQRGRRIQPPHLGVGELEVWWVGGCDWFKVTQQVNGRVGAGIQFQIPAQCSFWLNSTQKPDCQAGDLGTPGYNLCQASWAPSAPCSPSLCFLGGHIQLGAWPFLPTQLLLSSQTGRGQPQPWLSHFHGNSSRPDVSPVDRAWVQDDGKNSKTHGVLGPSKWGHAGSDKSLGSSTGPSLAGIPSQLPWITRGRGGGWCSSGEVGQRAGRGLRTLPAYTAPAPWASHEEILRPKSPQGEEADGCPLRWAFLAGRPRRQRSVCDPTTPCGLSGHGPASCIPQRPKAPGGDGTIHSPPQKSFSTGCARARRAAGRGDLNRPHPEAHRQPPGGKSIPLSINKD